MARWYHFFSSELSPFGDSLLQVLWVAESRALGLPRFLPFPDVIGPYRAGEDLDSPQDSLGQFDPVVSVTGWVSTVAFVSELTDLEKDKLFPPTAGYCGCFGGLLTLTTH